MTKRFLMILVLGLLWCGNAYSEIVRYDCKWPDNPEYKSIVYIFDFENKSGEIVVSSYSQTIGFIKSGDSDDKIFSNRTTATILKKDSEKVHLQNVENKREFFFNYINFVEYGDGYKNDIDCKSKKTLSSMIVDAKKTCKELGFTPETEKFSDCALKLYSQSVELAAKQNQQVVMQPQSSGSNVMTIYDPVRDNRALMNQGMRMLSGACTLGINC